MKIERKEKETFKPITLEITFESEQELIDLRAQLNVSWPTVKESCDAIGWGVSDLRPEYTVRLYHIITDICKGAL